MKTVDVIIPAYKPGEKFIRQQRMLQNQTYPVNRVIIVNTEAEFLDRDILKDYANVYVRDITAAEFDHGATRNLGVSLSTADYFLLMTDDAVPKDEKLVENLVRMMEGDDLKQVPSGKDGGSYGDATASDKVEKNCKIAAVYGRQLATEESSVDEKYSRNFNYPDRSFVKTIDDLPRLGIKTFFESNVCCLYRRDVFDELNGFPNHTIFNEDMIYCSKMLKAGYASAYCAEAEVLHAHNYNGIQQLHRNFDLGVSQADNPEVFGGIKSEGEGIRLVKGNALSLLKKGRIFSTIRLIWISACKYIGYRLGKNYKKLSRKTIMKLTMNKHYWD
ncbi:putative glycosyltransferase [Lachnospiraceae bacterium JC7]|nr:putative glycosyltransferase [Lachnospiraceae bacterium JC7]